MDVRAVQAARPAVEDIARRTPVLTSRTFSERAGGQVVLKAENLQSTGSFKVRGAAARLHALGDSCARGVVCASAGNHGQGVAAAAAARGVPCDVFVPSDASIVSPVTACTCPTTRNGIEPLTASSWAARSVIGWAILVTGYLWPAADRQGPPRRVRFIGPVML